MEIDITKQDNYSIKYTNNSTFDWSWRALKAGVAYDLSAKTIRMDIKKNKDYQSYVYRLVSPTEITISDTNLLTWSKVLSLPNDTYYYDVLVVEDNYYLRGGLIKVERNITT